MEASVEEGRRREVKEAGEKGCWKGSWDGREGKRDVRIRKEESKEKLSKKEAMGKKGKEVNKGKGGKGER